MAQPPKRDDQPAKYRPTQHDAGDTRIHGKSAAEKADGRIRCPKDATFMEKVKVGGMEIDRCAGCGSMWFDARELEKVLQSKDAAATVKNLDIGSQGRASGGRPLGELLCPRDRSPLIDVVDQKQAHVHELACTVCGGVLLDKGELRDLSEFTLSERLRSIFKRG